MEKIKFLLALFISKMVVLYINVFNKGRGTNLPGSIANKIQKDFISHFKNIDYNKVIFVTGTNGKSTTNNMIYNMFKTTGKTITSNLEGANLIGGIATSLIKNSTFLGKIKSEYICFEVDERYFEYIHKYLPAKHICITNLQKDQVQRNGEPNYIYQKLKKSIDKNTILYLNNDEPRSKSYEELSKKVIYYGISKNSKSYLKNDFYDVTMPCPKCHDKIQFNYYNVDNVGNFECLGCGFKSENKPKYLITNIDYEKQQFKYNNLVYNVSYTEPFFMYNYALCIAVGKEFKLKDDKIKESFENFLNVQGRLESFDYKGKNVKYIRMKQENPETLQSAFNYISYDKTPKIVVLYLGQLDDFKPYYTNTFYTFDCNIKDMNVTKYVCWSKVISYDVKNRLIYSGFDKDKITVIPYEENDEFLKWLAKEECKNVYLITKLDKYNNLIKSIKEKKNERD